MAKMTKVWLIIAAFLILIGGILFAGVMKGLDWDFAKLSTMQFEERTYEVTSDFTDVNVLVDTADVRFYHTEDEKISVVCYTDEKLTPEVAVADGVLTVTVKDNRAWHERIGIQFRKSKVEVYLPKGEYGKLFMKSITGSAVISGELAFESIDISAHTGDVFCYADAKKSININVTTGEIRLGGKSAQSVKLKATTGDISLWGVVIAEQLCVTGTTGDVYMEGCDAGSIFVKITTGDVECSFLTPKKVSAHSTTGKVSVPDFANGGSCEIKTTTGDIEVVIKE